MVRSELRVTLKEGIISGAFQSRDTATQVKYAPLFLQIGAKKYQVLYNQSGPEASLF